MNKLKNRDTYFYGGSLTSLFPILFLIISIIILVTNKTASLKIFWVPGLMSIIISFILFRNKKEFSKTCISFLKDDTLLSCIIIFILSGIISSIFKTVGVSDSLLMLFSKVGLDARFLPLIVFTACCLISTSIGTSTGTISLAVPVFLPLITSINCSPSLILGAIISGSFFGDNLSPISDTTIISVNTMHVKMFDALKKRIKISILSFTISCIMYMILGFVFIQEKEIVLEYSGTFLPLVMLLIPVFLFIYLSKNNDVISALLISIFLSIIISIIFGFTSISDIFGKNSFVISGIESVFGVIVFWLFLFIILGFVNKKYIFDIIIKKICDNKKNNSVKSNVFGVIVIIVSILTVSNNTAAMSMISGFIDGIFVNKSQIDKANIFDGLSCAVPGLLPYNTAFMLMIGLAYELNCLSNDFSIISILPFSINSIVLLVIYIIIAIYNSKRLTY